MFAVSGDSTPEPHGRQKGVPGATQSSRGKRTEGDGVRRLCWAGEEPYAPAAHRGKIQQTWAQRQKDDSRGMAYKDPALPWKEIQGIWITLGTDETYRGWGTVRLESAEVHGAEADVGGGRGGRTNAANRGWEQEQHS